MKDMPGLAVKDTLEMLWSAYHEAGHTVRAASWALPISRVSIEPSPNGLRVGEATPACPSGQGHHDRPPRRDLHLPGWRGR